MSFDLNQMLPRWGSSGEAGEGVQAHCADRPGAATPSVSAQVAPIHLPLIALRAGGGLGAIQ